LSNPAVVAGFAFIAGAWATLVGGSVAVVVVALFGAAVQGKGGHCIFAVPPGCVLTGLNAQFAGALVRAAGAAFIADATAATIGLAIAVVVVAGNVAVVGLGRPNGSQTSAPEPILAAKASSDVTAPKRHGRHLAVYGGAFFVLPTARLSTELTLGLGRGRVWDFRKVSSVARVSRLSGCSAVVREAAACGRHVDPERTSIDFERASPGKLASFEAASRYQQASRDKNFENAKISRHEWARGRRAMRGKRAAHRGPPINAQPTPRD
jgi:hypothetical protein